MTTLSKLTKASTPSERTKVEEQLRALCTERGCALPSNLEDATWWFDLEGHRVFNPTEATIINHNLHMLYHTKE